MTTITNSVDLNNIIDAAIQCYNDIEQNPGDSDWGKAYAAVLVAMSHLSASEQESTLDAKIWVAGAMGVNTSNGVFADYIRDYTAEQYVLRNGSLPGDFEQRLQNASNDIAENFLKTLLYGTKVVQEPDLWKG